MSTASNPINSSLIRLEDKRSSQDCGEEEPPPPFPMGTVSPFNTSAHRPSFRLPERIWVPLQTAQKQLAKHHIPLKILHLLQDEDKFKATGVNSLQTAPPNAPCLL